MDDLINHDEDLLRSNLGFYSAKPACLECFYLYLSLDLDRLRLHLSKNTSHSAMI